MKHWRYHLKNLIKWMQCINIIFKKKLNGSSKTTKCSTFNGSYDNIQQKSTYCLCYFCLYSMLIVYYLLYVLFLQQWYEMQCSVMVKLSLGYKSKSPSLLLVSRAVLQGSKPHGCRCWNPCNLTTLLKRTMKWRHKCTFTVSFSRFISRWAMRDLMVQ